MAEKLTAEIEIEDPKAALDDLKEKISAGLEGIKIDGGFTDDIKKGLTDASGKALSLQSSLKSLAAVDPKGKGLDWISKQALSSQKEIAKVNQQLQTISKLSTQTSSKSLLKIYEDDAKALTVQLEKAEKDLTRLQQARANKAAPAGSRSAGESGGSGALDAVAGEAGIPLTTAAAAAVAAGAIIKTGKDIFEAAKSSQDATRVLSASAKQAGLDFDLVNEKSAKFAELTAQGKTAAADSYASIVQFSKQAGKTDEIDKFTQALADLTAAKGIDKKAFPDLLSQLKTGQDEVFDKLAGANPSKFYNEFAQSIGTTADKLTDAQKAQIRFDAILKLGSMFNGEAEKKLKSLSGQADSLGAAFENLYTRAGNAAAPFIKAQLENVTGAIDFVKGTGAFASPEEQAKIRADAQAASEAKAKQFVEDTRDIQKKIDEAAKKPFASLEALAFSKLDSSKYLLESVAKEIDETKADGTKLRRLENIGEVNARLQQIRDDATKIAQAEAEAFKSKYERVLADKNQTPSILLALRAEFEQVQNLFPAEVKEKFRREIAEAVSGSVAKGFETALADPNISAAKLQENLKKLQAGVSGLLGDTTKGLISNYEKAIKSMAEKAAGLRDSIRDDLTASAGKNNPLVKLMVDFESATDRAEKRFGQFGSAVVKQMAELEQKNISAQINQILYDGSKKALGFEAQARQLRNTPETGLDQFQQRLTASTDRLNFLAQDRDLARQQAQAAFFAKEFNPNNPKTFNASRFSPAELSRFGEGVSRGRGESAQDFQKRLNDFGETSIRIFDAAKEIRDLNGTDLKGTGAFGREAVADKILSAIPDRSELLKRLNSSADPSVRDDAQFLLDQQERALADKRAGEAAKFQDSLAQAAFKDSALTDAKALLDNLGKTKGLTDEQRTAEFLNITGEIGTENLPASLRKARIQALNTAAEQTRGQAAEAAKQAQQIFETMGEINKQLKAGGLLVKNSSTPIVEIQVQDGTISATQRTAGARANSSDVVQ